MSFGGILRQSTAVDVIIGPFVSSTDGDTEMTGLTISQADVRLSKNGQTAAQKNDNTTCAHDADGFYNCELDATDTDTVGQLTLYVHEATSLAVRHDYQVIEEAVYDISYAASATGLAPANVTQWNGSAVATPTVAGVPEVDVTHWIGTAAATPTTAGVPEVDIVAIEGNAAVVTQFRRSLLNMHDGSVTGAATTTTLIDSTLTQPHTDALKGRIVIFEGNVTAALADQATDITAFNPTTDQLTFTALTTAPASGDRYIIV